MKQILYMKKNDAVLWHLIENNFVDLMTILMEQIHHTLLNKQDYFQLDELL